MATENGKIMGLNRTPIVALAAVVALTSPAADAPNTGELKYLDFPCTARR
jgi:hypothetical protein